MRLELLLGCMVAVGAFPAPLGAQEPPREEPGAAVAALDVALFNANATRQSPTDTAAATLATAVLHAELARLLPGQIAEASAVQEATRSDSALAIAGRHSCSVILACARSVGRSVEARWIVLPKLSKVAAVWLLTAQLVHVPSGATALEYTAELTGQETMVRAGARNLARRVARTVRAGGAASDFPAP